MRTLKFEQITDTRFGEDEQMLIARISTLDQLFSRMPIGVEKSAIRKLDWRDGSFQWRINYYVWKDRRVTWDQIYATVNSVCPVPYKFA